MEIKMKNLVVAFPRAFLILLVLMALLKFPEGVEGERKFQGEEWVKTSPHHNPARMLIVWRKYFSPPEHYQIKQPERFFSPPDDFSGHHPWMLQDTARHAPVHHYRNINKWRPYKLNPYIILIIYYFYDCFCLIYISNSQMVRWE